MLERVGQRLLDDAKGGELDTDRQWLKGVGVERDPQPGTPEPVRESRDVGDAVLRVRTGLGPVVDEPEQRTDLPRRDRSRTLLQRPMPGPSSR